MNGAYPVRQGYLADTPLQLLSRGFHALAGVTDEAKAMLAAMKVATVLDVEAVDGGPAYAGVG